MEQRQICLEGLPTSLFTRSQVHHADLFRELAMVGGRFPEMRMLNNRLRLVATEVNRRMGDLRVRGEEATEAARASGRSSLDLVITAPTDLAPFAREMSRLLDEVEARSRRSSDLLTLAAPPDVIEIRRWFLEEAARQSEGAPSRPWPGTAEPAGIRDMEAPEP